MRQQVLPLLPAEAAPIGPVAGLVETEEGGVVFVAGLAAFAFDSGDLVGRRLAAVQLVETGIASAVEVSEAFAVTTRTLLRWRQAVAVDGVTGLVPDRPGPKGPSKLTEQVVARIRRLHADGASLAAIGAQVGVDTATVRVALGRRAGSAGWQARHGTTTIDDDTAGEENDNTVPGEDDDENVDGDDDLPVLPAPEPRTAERELARYGLLKEAPVVFTPGAHLPLAGLLLVLPALAHLRLVEVFAGVYGRLRHGFYGLRATVLMLVFLALLREPRAEGATRIRPADLGRLLGLDRAPEVKTIRRKLAELTARRRGAQLQAGLARAHAAAVPEALGFLHVDGHTRVYYGTRNLPKAHIARLHMAAHASAETWIGDAEADPLFVITALPGASLAGELTRLIPQLRAVLGPRRKPTVIFDRGGWSPTVFKAMIDAGLHILTYRKAPFDPVDEQAFRTIGWTAPDGVAHRYRLAESSVELPWPGGDTLPLRQVTRLAEDGAQVPILTSNTRLAASAVCWRMTRRWRQENYFKYARAHFALDGLDSYADTPDDPRRLVPNPAKKKTRDSVERARTGLAAANADLASAVDDATVRAGRPEAGGRAVVDPAAATGLATALEQLDRANAQSRATPTHLPLGQVRPDARLLNEERKLITHAIRMSAYNAESILARMLHGHYARADDEARALVREAFTLSGDIDVRDGQLHVRLDPATAPRRSRALAALCQELTATETIYPGTDLTIAYSVKHHPDPS